MGTESLPPPPDPTATINAQSAANKEAVREAAKVNQFNQVSPFGTRTFTGEIGEPDRLETVAFGPSGQRQFDITNQIAEQLLGIGQGRAGQISQDPLSFEGLAPVQTDFSGDVNAVEQATFNRVADLLNPQFDRQSDRLNADLSARGIPVGAELRQNQFEDLNRGQNQALLSAANDAVLAGRGEQSRLFNQGLAGRQQGISELLAERTQPFQELAALIRGAPVAPPPQFAPTGQFGPLPVDVAGIQFAANNAQQNAFNARNQNRLGLFGDIAGLAGTLGGAAIGGPFGGIFR